MRTRPQTQRSHGIMANQVSRLPLLAGDRGGLSVLDLGSLETLLKGSFLILQCYLPISFETWDSGK